MLAGDLADRIARVASIQAGILLGFPPRDFRTLEHNLSQRPIQQLGVVKICATDGDRQREPMAIDQQAALASFFPRSVGFRPARSVASGALPMAPSTACHCQAMPCIPSYSARPACRSF